MKGVIDIFIVIPLSLSLSLTNHPLWEYTSGSYSIGSYSLLCINIIQNTREISEDHALTANHHQQPEWSLIYLKKKSVFGIIGASMILPAAWIILCACCYGVSCSVVIVTHVLVTLWQQLAHLKLPARTFECIICPAGLVSLSTASSCKGAVVYYPWKRGTKTFGVPCM